MGSIWGQEVLFNRHQARNYFWIVAQRERKIAFSDLIASVYPYYKPLDYFLSIDDEDIPFEFRIETVNVHDVFGIDFTEMPICFFTNKQLGVLIDEHGTKEAVKELRVFGDKLWTWLEAWRLTSGWCAELVKTTLKQHRATVERSPQIPFPKLLEPGKVQRNRNSQDFYTKKTIMLRRLPNKAISFEYIDPGGKSKITSPYRLINEGGIQRVLPPREFWVQYFPEDGWNFHLGEDWKEAEKRLFEGFQQYLTQYRDSTIENAKTWQWWSTKEIEIVVRNIIPIDKKLQPETLEWLAPERTDKCTKYSRQSVQKRIQGLSTFLGIERRGTKRGRKKNSKVI